MINRRLTRGFTLLELIIVLVILAILASAAVSKFVDLSQKAFEVQEKSTIGALRSGVILFHTKRCLEGTCRWYGTAAGEDNPFNDLLENPPDNLKDDAPTTGPGDGKNWCINRAMPEPPNSWFYIWCPHASFFVHFAPNTNMWRYYYAGPNAGRIIHDRDYNEGSGGAWGYQGH